MMTEEKVAETVIEEKKRIFKRLYFVPWLLLVALLLLSNILLFNKVKTLKKAYSEMPSTNTVMKSVYMEAIKLGYVSVSLPCRMDFLLKIQPQGEQGKALGKWIVDTNVNVQFEWELPISKSSTESLIASQVETRVNVSLQQQKALEVKFLKLESIYTESIKLGKQIEQEVIKRNYARWTTNNGVVNFQWEEVSPQTQKTSTECAKCATNKYNVQREEPFTLENYRLIKDLKWDFEGDLTKSCLSAIDGQFPVLDISILEAKLKLGVSAAIHKAFDGLETLNKVDKKYNIKK